jgi:prepilin peptidase CpaA
MDRLGPDAWAYVALATVLLAASVTDVRSGRIYNWITYPAILVGLVGHLCFGGWSGGRAMGSGVPALMGLADALAGFAVGFGLMLLAWLAGGVGGGDAKIMGAVGALTGWRFTITAMFYGFATAAVMAVVVMISRRATRRTLGRVGRFLWLLLARAKPGDPAGPDSPKIPFGLALCIGSAVALALVFCGLSQRLFLI